MKKIFSIVFAGLAMLSLVACSESDYNDKYEDPSKTTTVGVPQVFTSVLISGNTWMNPVYYRYYTQSTTSGLFSGVIGDYNSRGRFRGASEGYFNTRWTNFYNMLAQYRLLETTYENLSDTEKPANEIFVHCGRVVLLSQLHEMLSLWGDVPFSGAGYLWKDGKYEAAKEACVYDNDADLYKQILAELKESAEFLAKEHSSAALTSMKNQDYTLAAGDPVKWQKYVNSLRLRIALHLATNGDCVTEAKAAIAEILGNPTKYPVIESNDDNMGVSGDTQTDTFNYGKSMSQALRTGSYAAGSQAVLSVMNVPANGIPTADTDPRLAAMYDCNPDGEYVAPDITKSNAEISQISDDKHSEYVDRGMTGASYYCEIDTIAIAGYASYQGNANLGGLWVGAAEVALSKAECYLMGYGVSADQAKAKQCFIEGVKLSSEFFWDMKVNSSIAKAGNDSYYGYRELAVPTSADFVAYAEKIWQPTQECVCSQLWLNFGYMNELEAWNVVRRTGFPVVKFAKDNKVSSSPTPPNRLPYVSDELNYNSENCQAAIAINYDESTGYYTNLFWAKKDYYVIVAEN